MASLQPLPPQATNPWARHCFVTARTSTSHNTVLLGPKPSLSDIQPRLALREPLLALGLLGLLLPELGLLCVMRLVCAVDNVTGR